MNRARFSRISHGEMRFWNPIQEEELVRVLRAIPLCDGDRVLDYGCGDGEVLAELAGRCALRITGVDVNPEAIAICRVKLSGNFLAEPFDSARFAAGSFDLAINIGASPGLRPLLEEITPLVRPGGRVLIGDGYWRRPPTPEYLAFLGASPSDMASHEENCHALVAAGFELEQTVISSLEAWDRYEDCYDANMIAYLREHPEDVEGPAFEARRSRWRAMYLQFGRGTMGFALYQGRKRLDR